MLQLQSALGVAALLGFAWLISENRRAVSLKRIGIGLAVTVVLAVLFLKVPPITAAFGSLNGAVDAIAAASRAGTSFVFGYVGGGALPFELKFPGHEFVLAFQALPIVLLMSVLTTLLFYWGILPPIIRGFAFALRRTMGVGGAVGLSTAANIFVGHVEAPLFIRPYLAQLSRGELFVVMTGGMAGIAGTVLVLYAQFLGPSIPDAAGHLIIASVLGAPAAVLIGQIMVPDDRDTATSSLTITEPVAESTMDAIAKGATSGLTLLLNMIAMLIVFVALVHLANAILGLLPALSGVPITLQRILGDHGAGVLADRHPLGAGADRGLADGHQDRAQRADRLSRHGEIAARRARCALAAVHALCDVRLRQLRQCRHHDRRTHRDGAGAAQRRDLARLEVDRVRHARDPADGRDRRRAELEQTGGLRTLRR